MDKNKIILITDKNDFYGQTRKPWVPLKLDLFINKLNELGFEVKKYNYDEISLNINSIKNEIIYYVFSQKSHTREFIKSIIFQLSKNNIVIPNYNMLLCHEDKAYQELYKTELGIKSLQAYYLNDINTIKKLNIKYPIIFKTIDGSNGDGVFLCKNESELLNKYNEINKLPLKIKLDLFRRKYLRSEKKYDYYNDYNNKTDYEQFKQHSENNKQILLQEFIPNLKYDYRVLVIYDKYFVMKRMTKDGDFRASGSKKFVIEDKVDFGLLDFAKSIFTNFNSPFLSMDIIEGDDKYYLIEYQASHFGVSAIVRNNKYYYDNEGWNFSKDIMSVEEELAEGLGKYLNNMVI